MANDQQIMDELTQFVAESSPEEVRAAFTPPNGTKWARAALLSKENLEKILFEVQLKIHGGINEYANHFLSTLPSRLENLSPEALEKRKNNIRFLAQSMMDYPGLTAENRARVQSALSGALAPYYPVAPAAGRRRRRTARKKKRTTRKRRVS